MFVLYGSVPNGSCRVTNGSATSVKNVTGRLQLNYVRSLRSTVALRNLEFDRLAFIQRLEAFALNRGEMNEYVVAVLYLNEAVAFLCVKPFNCSFQLNNLLK